LKKNEERQLEKVSDRIDNLEINIEILDDNVNKNNNNVYRVARNDLRDSKAIAESNFFSNTGKFKSYYI